MNIDELVASIESTKMAAEGGGTSGPAASVVPDKLTEDNKNLFAKNVKTEGEKGDKMKLDNLMECLKKEETMKSASDGVLLAKMAEEDAQADYEIMCKQAEVHGEIMGSSMADSFFSRMQALDQEYGGLSEKEAAEQDMDAEDKAYRQGIYFAQGMSDKMAMDEDSKNPDLDALPGSRVPEEAKGDIVDDVNSASGTCNEDASSETADAIARYIVEEVNKEQEQNESGSSAPKVASERLEESIENGHIAEAISDMLMGSEKLASEVLEAIDVHTAKEAASGCDSKGKKMDYDDDDDDYDDDEYEDMAKQKSKKKNKKEAQEQTIIDMYENEEITKEAAARLLIDLEDSEE